MRWRTARAPETDPELALRAAQLTSLRGRRALARTLRRTVDDAHRPIANVFRVPLIRRRAVLEAEPAIRAMIDRLDGPADVAAEGMAMADEIIANANRSPLYNPSEPGTLRRQIKVATEALEPRRGAGRVAGSAAAPSVPASSTSCAMPCSIPAHSTSMSGAVS